MAYSGNISRLSRLTAILLKLQSKSWVQVAELATDFQVSKRTIYRDLGALGQAGVPLVQEEGKGYRIMPGYNLPPIMFTEAEANAIIFGKKLIAKTKDASLINAFNKATDKIKSVLKNSEKAKVELLAERTIIGKNWKEERTSNYLSEIQKALTNYTVLKIDYLKEGVVKQSTRLIEPFAIYHNTSEHWVLIAWCRLRKDFRNFRLDRIQQLSPLSEQFPPHEMTMQAYVEIQRKKHFSK